MGVVGAIVGGAIGVAVAFALPPQYTASSTFIAKGPSTSLLPNALQGIAATVGLAGVRDYSPQFYADLLTSDPVLQAALDRKYPVPERDGGGQKTYYEIEDITGRDSSARRDAAMRYLRKRVTTRADVRTNIISLYAEARYPEMSRELAFNLLQALDSMNISFRQEQSRDLREYFGSRVADAQKDLDSAETALRQFLERNRVTQGSPLLTFEQARLSRTADLKRAVYTTVVQQYEEAKMQEARNVPVLTILTRPVAPARKSGPPRRLIVVVAVLLGFAAHRIPDLFRSLRSRVESELVAFRSR